MFIIGTCCIQVIFILTNKEQKDTFEKQLSDPHYRASFWKSSDKLFSTSIFPVCTRSLWSCRCNLPCCSSLSLLPLLLPLWVPWGSLVLCMVTMKWLLRGGEPEAGRLMGIVLEIKWRDLGRWRFQDEVKWASEVVAWAVASSELLSSRLVDVLLAWDRAKLFTVFNA